MLDRCVRHCLRFYSSQGEIDRIKDGSKPIQILTNLIELIRGFEQLDDSSGFLAPLCLDLVAWMEETDPTVENWKLLGYAQILVTLGKVMEHHHSHTQEGLANAMLCRWPVSKSRQPQCRHTWLLASLQGFQMHAYADVRGKVMLTIATTLLSELTELMVEAALVAEEMPLDPRVYVMNGGVTTVKKEYSCEAVQALKQDADSGTIRSIGC